MRRVAFQLIHVTAMNTQASPLPQAVDPRLSWEMLCPVLAESSEGARNLQKLRMTVIIQTCV